MSLKTEKKTNTKYKGTKDTKKKEIGSTKVKKETIIQTKRCNDEKTKLKTLQLIKAYHNI